ncbi:MAG: serine dehydratase subunit alpha family protein, partial [Bacteroidales bacterium]|nr:serine dehydratase subunit alpha family protein [Bacteroidales bacterium]
MNDREKQIIGLIHREVKPALGCTEPIAVALAVAKAIEILQADSGLDRLKADILINVAVSGNILKNGMGVGIPGTGMTGLHIAAALGAVCGRSAYGLEVLGDMDGTSLARAKELV